MLKRSLASYLLQATVKKIGKKHRWDELIFVITFFHVWLIMKNIKNLRFTFFLNCSWWRCLLYVFPILQISSFWWTFCHKERDSQSFERKISSGTFGLIAIRQILLLLLQAHVFPIAHFRKERHQTVWLFQCLGLWTKDVSWFPWFL